MQRIPTIITMLMFLFACILQGCSGRWESVRAGNIEPFNMGIKSLRNYTTGEEKTASVGEPIFQVRKVNQGSLVYEVVAPEEFRVVSKNKYIPSDLIIAPGSRIPIRTRVNWGSGQYVVPVKGGNNLSWGILVSEEGYVTPSCLYSGSYLLMYCPPSMTFTPGYRFDVKTKPVEISSAGSYELIFSGRNETSLNMLYREYSAEDLARPSFFQNLTYSPNAKQIRFKDFVIQVKDATNEQITYSVVSDDDTKVTP